MEAAEDRNRQLKREADALSSKLAATEEKLEVRAMRAAGWS